MKSTFVLLAVLASGSAFGACEKAAIAERPEVPNGEVATIEQMQEARAAVAAYVDAMEAYLECVEPPAFQHNYIVTRLEGVADEFNAQRERFVQRQEAVAAN
jgi:hypothetical protein